MASLRVQFGKHLRQLRLERGLTQERLAEESDVSIDFLSLVERGKNAPSFETIERLTRALQVTVVDLFTFDVQPSERNRVRQARAHRRTADHGRIG